MLDKRVGLVKGLLKKTKAKELNWEITGYETTFQTAFPEYTIQIGEYHTSYSQHDYLITIQNKDSVDIDNISDEELYPVWNEAYKNMRELYQLARRQALGVDKVLDDLLQELGVEKEDYELEDPNSINNDDDIPF